MYIYDISRLRVKRNALHSSAKYTCVWCTSCAECSKTRRFVLPVSQLRFTLATRNVKRISNNNYRMIHGIPVCDGHFIYCTK